MKQKIFMLLAAVLLSSASMFAQSNEPLKGDVNGDGTVDVADVTAVIKIMKDGGGTAEQTKYYFYVGTTKPTSLDQCTIVSEYPAEQIYTNNSSNSRYDKNLKAFKDGELLRLPITVGDKAGSFSGSITVFRTVTAEAVSHTGTGATFPIKVTDEATAIGASLNDNGQRINENYYSIDGVKFSGEPRKKGVYIRNGRKVLR